MNPSTIQHPPDVARRLPDDARARAAIVSRRSLSRGVVAAVLMAIFYVAVVRGASGSWTHLWEQARQDWAYLTVIIIGFGTQVALVAELRYRHRLNAATTAAGGAGAGASTVGMVACCAHHIADLFPLIGATGAATFVTEFRVPFMLAGIAVTAAGVFVAARRLHRVKVHVCETDTNPSNQGESRCAAD